MTNTEISDNNPEKELIMDKSISDDKTKKISNKKTTQNNKITPKNDKSTNSFDEISNKIFRDLISKKDSLFKEIKELERKKDELEFIDEGYGVQRYEIMYNKFILIGPKSDPLKISQEEDILSALKKIYNSEYKFISRDDNSGTHKKEQELWSLANIKKFDSDKYIKTGTSMANTLNIASEIDAYTISDKGTWLSFKNKNNLKILFEGGDELHNPYGIIAVNPEKFPHVEYKKSQKFIEWLITGEGKDVINRFTYNGEKLFHTN